jgi:hypothetical protein
MLISSLKALVPEQVPKPRVNSYHACFTLFRKAVEAEIAVVA